MTEEVTPTTEEVAPTTEESNLGEENNPKQHKDWVRYEKLQKVVHARQAADALNEELEAKLAEFDKEKKERIEAEQVKRGEFDTVIAQYKSDNEKLKTRADAFDAYEVEQRAVLIKKLPENKQELAQDMSLSNLFKFVDVEESTKLKIPDDKLPGEQFGEHKDLIEYAKSDPKRFLKDLDDGKIKF